MDWGLLVCGVIVLWIFALSLWVVSVEMDEQKQGSWEEKECWLLYSSGTFKDVPRSIYEKGGV